VPTLVPIKRGREGGDLRGCKTLIGFLWKNGFLHHVLCSLQI
jgi:hypothetical protein